MTCHVINNTMLLIGVLLTLFCAVALAQYGDPICVAGDPQVAPCFVCVSFDGTALCGDGETDCYFGIDPFDPACQISPPVYYTDAPVPQCHPDDIPPTLPPIPGLENCQACLNVNTFVKCSGSEEEECTWFPCFYEADPICAAGDELYTCVVCVSLDGTALCAEGETNCNYGLDPTDPACQEAPATGEPMPEEPECVAGDIFPFLPLVGDCWVCINLDETDLCAEGETTCHWGYDPIRPECRVTEPPPPQCHPDDIPPTDFTGLEYCCLNVDTDVRCSGEDGEACTWKYCIFEL
ncbi:uncharacterized protein, partial [Amphiura filiformis]|uniref:uncharacterized protein n=1 Tax=Amphiura filiformis TaxID=82378 RepID=UPI003B22245E